MPERAKQVAAAIAGATMGFIAGDAPGAVIGAKLAMVAADNGGEQQKTFPRMTKLFKKSSFKKKYSKKSSKTKYGKGKKRTSSKSKKRLRSSKAKKRLVKLIEHVIDHDAPLGTYKHEGVLGLTAPENGRSLMQQDNQQRFLNFGSPQDIQYIASTLFNGNSANIKGYQGTNANMFEKTGLKIQVISHEVSWCARNCDNVEATLIHYEFKARKTGTQISNSGGGVTYPYTPLDCWSRAYMDVNYSTLTVGQGGVLPFLNLPAPGASVAQDFLRNLRTEPGDVIKVLEKWYKVKRREYKLLPGQCKVLPKTNVFKDVEYDYPGACLDGNQDVVANIKDSKKRLRSSWHLFMHYNEFLPISNGVTNPKTGDCLNTVATWIGDGLVPMFRPANGWDNPATGASGLVVDYYQKVRIRAPTNTAIANRKEAITYVSALNPPVASLHTGQVLPMSGVATSI